MTTLLYFAWVRERIGTGAEEIDLPADVATVTDLLDWLSTRSDAHSAALVDRSRLRVAIDQRFAASDASVAGAGEIAIFPQVTGG